ncbi:metal ABC transporter substrate-binding protein [Cellulomonas alba]|uniref:Metal ABC transporter substrate-binding protein n=1 Tax=Cellulomonas alba TaxID=3053467 RepID=A0ABT7SC42_9CELL|nr:metal ABC transporter substrate-binding protein [Cellulomonas alba]MDM7853752.1 metal ABC transporter substrate-binding protein [Cellulomonas alba]
MSIPAAAHASHRVPTRGERPPSRRGAGASRRGRARSWAAALVVAVAAPFALAGCAQSAQADDGHLQVMTSFYPLQFVAEQVGGDLVHVRSLTPPGAEPHDVELSPRQVSQLETADLVVYQSGFQAAVDDAVEQVRPKRVVDASAHVHLMTVDEEHRHGARSGDDADHEADDESHDAHVGVDPHFWLDPDRLRPVVDAVADQLAAADPASAETFRTHAAALDAQLADLTRAFTTGLETCRTRTFVTSHEAFGYLAERFDLVQVGISGLDPESDPSPARLAEVGRLVKDQGITTIFYETLVSPKVAKTLASELGVTAEVLDPIEGITTTGDDYFSVQHRNLDALRGALGCS